MNFCEAYSGKKGKIPKKVNGLKGSIIYSFMALIISLFPGGPCFFST